MAAIARLGLLPLVLLLLKTVGVDAEAEALKYVVVRENAGSFTPDYFDDETAARARFAEVNGGNDAAALYRSDGQELDIYSFSKDYHRSLFVAWAYESDFWTVIGCNVYYTYQDNIFESIKFDLNDCRGTYNWLLTQGDTNPAGIFYGTNGIVYESYGADAALMARCVEKASAMNFWKAELVPQFYWGQTSTDMSCDGYFWSGTASDCSRRCTVIPECEYYSTKGDECRLAKTCGAESAWSGAVTYVKQTTVTTSTITATATSTTPTTTTTTGTNTTTTMTMTGTSTTTTGTSTNTTTETATTTVGTTTVAPSSGGTPVSNDSQVIPSAANATSLTVTGSMEVDVQGDLQAFLSDPSVTRGFQTAIAGITGISVKDIKVTVAASAARRLSQQGRRLAAATVDYEIVVPVADVDSIVSAVAEETPDSLTTKVFAAIEADAGATPPYSMKVLKASTPKAITRSTGLEGDDNDTALVDAAAPQGASGAARMALVASALHLALGGRRALAAEP